MEAPYKPPSILRLTGVTLDDYKPIEDVADELLLQSGTGAAGPEEPAPESVYPMDKIPRTFTHLNDWPLHTNLRCWQCDFSFDDRPKFVPTYVRESNDGCIEFGVHGNMCSFNCAELWIEINYAGKDDRRWRAQDNLCLVYFIFTGYRTALIRPAIHKTELLRYGGELDEETFSEKMRALDAIAGLRDHTPGSIIPERCRDVIVPEHRRIKAAIDALHVRTGLGGAPKPRAVTPVGTLIQPFTMPGEPLLVQSDSVWGVCGLAEAPEPVDSISIDDASIDDTSTQAPSSNEDLDAIINACVVADSTPTGTALVVVGKATPVAENTESKASADQETSADPEMDEFLSDLI